MTHSLTNCVRFLPLAAVVLLAGCASLGNSDGPADPAGYRSYVTGNPADVVTPTSGLWVLQGGGDDVVLRASGTDDYNDSNFGLCQGPSP